VKGDEERITEFEKFERNTVSQELDDLEVLLDAVKDGRFDSRGADPSKIILMGHSRGGGIAIISAASAEVCNALVTLSSIATFDRWTAHQKEAWRKNGYLPLSKDTAVSPLRLGIGVLNDLTENHGRLDIRAAASRVKVPWLIVHGKTDVTVPPREAEELYNAAEKKTTQFAAVDHAGHLYNAATRSEDEYRTLNGILDLIIHWLHKQFSKEHTWNKLTLQK